MRHEQIIFGGGSKLISLLLFEYNFALRDKQVQPFPVQRSRRGSQAQVSAFPQNLAHNRKGAQSFAGRLGRQLI